MRDQPKGAGDEDASPTEAQDIRDQGVVLIHVLSRHPTLLTIPDLVREITSGSKDFAEGDNLERAVRDLTGVGLLHCPSGLAVPSPAALRFLKIIYEGRV
ncbi:MAG TPA: hypothetical protein VHQ43_11275 [Solirubrobacterales bacterium]|jgi:hypothetical protein|nr:hypothetical protein [Solirubrobacterales bacterium]